jgi:hypothetical protein
MYECHVRLFSCAKRKDCYSCSGHTIFIRAREKKITYSDVENDEWQIRDAALSLDKTGVCAKFFQRARLAFV